MLLQAVIEHFSGEIIAQWLWSQLAQDIFRIWGKPNAPKFAHITKGKIDLLGTILVKFTLL